MINVDEKKNKIIEVIKARGPSLPIHISREIELSSLFTSAIMSEMISGKMLKTSHLKVGGSPLYYVEGQQPLLENFSNYLGAKEKEVFLFLKEKGIAMDEALSPAFRVAIRGLKDFAVPLKVNVKNEEKIFWRYLTTPLEEAVKKIRYLTGHKEAEKEHNVEKREEKEESEKKTEIILEKKVEKRERKTVKSESNFTVQVEGYIEKLGIRTIRNIEMKKKEVWKIARMNSSIGDIEVLLIAKEKKNITDKDLNIALERGQEMRMPVLLISNGKLNKKAAMQIETFKSYLIFRQME